MIHVEVKSQLHSAFQPATSHGYTFPASLTSVNSSCLRAQLPLHDYDVKCSSFSSSPHARIYTVMRRKRLVDHGRSVRSRLRALFISGGAPARLDYGVVACCVTSDYRVKDSVQIISDFSRVRKPAFGMSCMWCGVLGRGVEWQLTERKR